MKHFREVEGRGVSRDSANAGAEVGAESGIPGSNNKRHEAVGVSYLSSKMRNAAKSPAS